MRSSSLKVTDGGVPVKWTALTEMPSGETFADFRQQLRRRASRREEEELAEKEIEDAEEKTIDEEIAQVRSKN